jgi:hypothetical protein
MKYKDYYIIVGAGASGLTLAWYLSKYGKKVLIIEQNNKIGGCHKVNRVNGMFSEHGPRVYFDSFVNFIELLNDMNNFMNDKKNINNFGLSFYDVFVKYRFNLALNASPIILKHISFVEFTKLSIEFIKFILNKDKYKNITVLEFLNKNNFGNKIKKNIDLICRLSDGAGYDKFTLYEFFELINQTMFYLVYQPKKPNDILLFHKWKLVLEQTGNVKFLLNTKVVNIISNENKNITNLIVRNNNKYINIYGKSFILAIPPKNLVNILNNVSSDYIKNSFMNFNKLKKWELNSRYIKYISLTFHWNRKIKLDDVIGITETDWMIGFVKMSDYMDFNDKRSQTVLSIVITNVNVKSKYLNKTANECNDEEIKKEIIRQLNGFYKIHKLPKPDHIIMETYNDDNNDNKHNYENNDNKHNYENNDNKHNYQNYSFILSKAGYLKNGFKSKFNNLYTLGTHCGKSPYIMTTIESAITNAISLTHHLIPKSKENINIKTQFTLIDGLSIILFLFIYIIYLIYKNKVISLYHYII